MKNHLFLFTIGPVQSFIAQARKTQDLYAGSRLLSELCKAGIDKAGQEGGKVIFPSDINADALPNRFLCRFEGKSQDKLKSIGKAVQEAVEKAWQSIVSEAQREVKEHLTTPSDQTRWNEAFTAQINATFTYNWAFSDEFDNESAYEKAFKEVERRLGAAKNQRTFTPLIEQGRKCSLNGEMNALVFAKHGRLPAYTNGTVSGTVKNDSAKNVMLWNSHLISQGEGLSAPSFVKRAYGKGNGFPSTAAIATLYDVQNIGAKKGELKKFEGLFKDFDAQLYYEENLTERYFRKNNLDKEKLKDARKAHYAIKNDVKTKYYAILLFDADKMGEWLNGNNLKPETSLSSWHEELSKKLSSFAQEAKKFVDGESAYTPKDKTDDLDFFSCKQRGRTVYAGGDDFLGFLNLHYLLPTLAALRQMFKEQVSDPLQAQLEESKEITFSAGVSIAHYKMPLGEVLGMAHRAEQHAKNGGRNAFGLSVLKHSGEIHETVLKFKNKDGAWLTESLQAIISALQKEQFSSKFISSIQREFAYLGAANNETGLDDDHYRLVLETELNRLIERARDKSKSGKTKDISDHAQNLLSGNSDAQNVFRALSITDFIHRKLQGND